MGRVDFEVDGAAIDALIAAGNSSSLGLNLSADLGKVVEAAIGLMEELSKLGLLGGGGDRLGVCVVLRSIIEAAGDVDQLQDQRATGDDAGSSGKKVSADNVF